GNAYEWSHDAYVRDRAGSSKGEPLLDAGVDADFSDKIFRVLRSGTFIFTPANLRSAFRSGGRPSSRFTNDGLRPARTYPSAFFPFYTPRFRGGRRRSR